MTLTLDDLLTQKSHEPRPKIVCLCGSTRFMQAFQDANLRETLAGNIILSIGCNTKSDEDLIQAGVTINKEALDTLHLHKIDLADEVLILNVGGYIGESTLREVNYASRQGKVIRWLEKCPFCRFFVREEEGDNFFGEVNPVGYDFFGGLCLIGQITCCDTCLDVIETTNTEQEMLEWLASQKQEVQRPA